MSLVITGIKFYDESGFIYATSDKIFHKELCDINEQNKIGAEDISNSYKQLFSFMKFPEDCYVMFEKSK